jgi:hypothetical protein
MCGAARVWGDCTERGAGNRARRACGNCIIVGHRWCERTSRPRADVEEGKAVLELERLQDRGIDARGRQVDAREAEGHVDVGCRARQEQRVKVLGSKRSGERACRRLG